jgi:adenosylcobyric acid synthase
MSRAIMFQGTGSNVGKSMLVAGIARAFKNRGLRVAPFKPQNMSNNAAVTVDGGEIGRAQALQAWAAGLAPHTDMNPVLLKPETETGSQIVVQGKRFATVAARGYSAVKPKLMAPVLDSFERLKSQYDLVLVEGAGSPAEVNLRQGDIANMGFAQAADVPVVLCGDINRGGVIAQIVGTQNVLDDADCGKISAFLINMFRGDPSLFDDGYDLIKTTTGWPGLGVVPWFPHAWKLPAEDAMDLRHSEKGSAKIVCLCLSRMANFDDLDPLGQEPNVELIMLQAGQAIPGDADLVIIPGSKSTRGDLQYLRDQGWDIDLQAHVRRGGYILGICGGYQILGRTIDDPEGIEGVAGSDQGLGLLQSETVMTPNKVLTQVNAQHRATNLEFQGYEIHIGQTTGPDCDRPFAVIDGRADGATSPDGRIIGSYLHGMFSNDTFRAAFLAQLGIKSELGNYRQDVETTLDQLAGHLEQHVDLDEILRLAH